MSRRDLRSSRYMCDICHKLGPIVHSEYYPGPPKGWGGRTLHNCGLTNYTRDEDLCPKCLKKYGEPDLSKSVDGR